MTKNLYEMVFGILLVFYETTQTTNGTECYPMVLYGNDWYQMAGLNKIFFVISKFSERICLTKHVIVCIKKCNKKGYIKWFWTFYLYSIKQCIVR